MITYLTIKKEVEVINRITCDKCGGSIDDQLESQEMLDIDFIGGYNSVFGDGAHVQCHLCQYCLYKMIKYCYNEIDER